MKRWRDGHMALRWTAAGSLEAKKTFRKLKGHRLMPMLRDALQRQTSLSAQRALRSLNPV